MVLGRAEIAAGASALVLSFVEARTAQTIALRAAALILGMVILAVAVRIRTVNRALSAAISWRLRRWTELDVRDYATLLGLSGDYAVVEVTAEPASWLAGRELADLDLPAEGVLVLGVTRRDGSYVGAPTARTRISPHDTLILYGRAEQLAALSQRHGGAAGDAAHRASVAAHRSAEPNGRWTLPHSLRNRRGKLSISRKRSGG